MFSGILSFLDMCHPARSISMITKKSLKSSSDLLQKEAHHFTICIRKDKGSHSSQSHADCCIYVT